MWTKQDYGRIYKDGKWVSTPGRWTITNGHLSFDIHWTAVCKPKEEKTVPGPQYRVNPLEADEYADKILEILNTYGLERVTIPVEKHT